jgi:hypothetical protein
VKRVGLTVDFLCLFLHHSDKTAENRCNSRCAGGAPFGCRAATPRLEMKY